jgi:hypothetical protein|eukprot:SAG25_NODE_5311_length_674_cov_0.984348_2_plen_78_part_00
MQPSEYLGLAVSRGERQIFARDREAHGRAGPRLQTDLLRVMIPLHRSAHKLSWKSQSGLRAFIGTLVTQRRYALKID